MDIQLQDQTIVRRRTYARIIGIFFGVMIVLTFFSNTLNNFFLPRVKVEEPVSGALIKTISSEGVVEPRVTVGVYAEYSRRVVEMRVRPTDRVQRGQVLVLLEAGAYSEAIARELPKYERGRMTLEQFFAIVTGSEGGRRLALEVLAQNIADREQALATMEKLYASNAATLENVERARRDLLNAQIDYENKKQGESQKSYQDRDFLENVDVSLFL